MYLFFFFKQKTAYELRISDWSSDVCSSDLEEPERLEEQRNHDTERGQDGHHGAGDHQAVEDALDTVTGAELRPHLALRDCESKQAGRGRSEEHTSELQSLMRISYAVFCLKKKKAPQLHRID